jgi:hypothetical protein
MMGMDQVRFDKIYYPFQVQKVITKAVGVDTAIPGITSQTVYPVHQVSENDFEKAERSRVISNIAWSHAERSIEVVTLNLPLPFRYIIAAYVIGVLMNVGFFQPSQIHAQVKDCCRYAACSWARVGADHQYFHVTSC